MGGNLKTRLRSRRGSTIAEASIVLPLLILSVLTCLLISMFFCETTIRQCQLHQQLRCAADVLTGTTVRKGHSDQPEFTVESSREGAFRTVRASVSSRMVWRGLLRQRPSAESQSRWHAANGAEYALGVSLVRGGLGEK